MQPAKNKTIQGIIFVCIAFFSFTVMSMFNKMLVGVHHPFEIMFYRNLIALIPCLVYVVMTAKWHYFKAEKPKLVLMRGAIGCVSLFCTLSATQHLPMSTATTLFFTSTLMVPIMAVLFLKETVGWHRYVAIGIGMTGVIVAAQPSPVVTLIGVTFALFAGLGHASIQVLLRYLRQEKTLTVMLSFFGIGVVGGLFFMPFIASTPTPESALILLGVGVSGGVGQYFLTRGFQMAEANLLSPFNYTGLLWSMLFDVTIFGLVPTVTTLVGAGLIIASSSYIVHRENKERTKKAAHAGTADL